ncbi:Usp domain-containing protein [Caenorhabditis elegans]|uniref:Usp domain-containing protein n=1 Tax=Caenorhabditis elegans TaxID=6239 RepID=Q9N5J1_CAEEL|nr:Usp domain-containing protein [Caenorhabditis elegans]CCD61375.1 Usp domain-containing protein [Caenorhabditis elegans]|eukprot:NP_504113.1 Uncharacterized protein CELE_K09D9.9 [Caenorhabditis elegans]
MYRMRFRLLIFSASVTIVFLYLISSIFSVLQNTTVYSCQIPLEGKDPMIYGYLCAVDKCVYDLFEETNKDKFETMWRKLPESLNWCSTNAQMSVIRFTLRSEMTMFKVKNMIEKSKAKFTETCTAVVVSFDGDSSLRDLDLDKILKSCTIHHLKFSSLKAEGLANSLKRISSVIDVLIVGPSKGSSHLLFQQFLGDYYDFLPPVCQVNFAHTLPRSREENGFVESMQRLRMEKKFMLMGASKDRTDMHLNLFFENMDQKYCRERYFRYLSYF